MAAVPDDSHASRANHRIGLAWGANLERAQPGSRYGIVLALLLITYVFMASAPTGRWVPLVTVILQGTTLLAALAASEARQRLVRFSLIIIVLAVVGGVATLVSNTSEAHDGSSVLSFLLVGIAPVAIAASIARKPVIDIQSVLGAICIYVFIGMFFAAVFQAIGNLGSTSFFAQQKTATLADYLYFSFVTQTTVGYGDLTAAGGLGRAAAALEGLTGQVYLVTVVAMLVSQVARRNRSNPNPDS